MTTKHTPGQTVALGRSPGTWEVGPLDSEGVPIYSDSTDSADLIGYVYDVPSGDTEANARLIVRACNAHEALLAALEGTLDALYNETHGHADSPWIASVKAQARAAIKQAKGE